MKSSNSMDIEDLKEHIPLLQKHPQITQIHKGFSADLKYIAQSCDGQKLLLRIFDLNEYKQKQSEFDVLCKMKDYGVKCSRPICIGRLEETDKGYMLLSFIEGSDAADELPKYSDFEQFQIGIEAGRELRKMHQLKAPLHVKPWHERKLKKHQAHTDAYLASGVKIKNDTKIISFIEENAGLMKHRPNLFQHDDFHVGNLIVKDGQLSGIIDFNRFDWGDPIHEFLKVGMFSREVSIPFCIGQILGYHNNREPSELFWRLYALYLAMNLFSTIKWTLRVVPENLSEMMEKIYTVLEDHQYFRSIKPNWYKGI